MKVHCKYDELIPVSDLKPYPKNRNEHSKEQIDRLAKILSYQGIRAPIVCTRDKVIAKGHGTLQAIKKNKWKNAPIVYQDFENEDQLYSFVQSDNAIASWSELDFSGINEDIGSLDPSFDIDLLGIKNFTIEVADKGLCDPDEVPEVPKEPKSKLGDIYQLGNHRLMCGSSAIIDDFKKLMRDDKSDMIFTDPPYGVNYQAKNKMLNSLQSPKGGMETAIHGDDMSLSDLKQMLLDAFTNASTFLAEKCCYYVSAPQGGELGLMMMMMQEAGLPCRHMIVWVKNNAAFSMNRLDYDYKHEPILYGWPKNKTHEFYGHGDHKNSVWHIDRENNKLHPTMKPVAIMENAIKNSCPNGGIVLDMFGGSGSTMMAAEKTGRFCRTMEISPQYCDVQISRWEKFSGQKAQLLSANNTAVSQ